MRRRIREHDEQGAGIVHDELDLRIRAADPARTPVDYGSSDHAQQILEKILSGEAEEVIPVSSHVIPWGKVAVVVAVAVAVVLSVVFPLNSPQASATTPVPLVFSAPPGTTTESLALIERMLLRPGAQGEALREAKSVGWYLKIDGDSTVVEPGPIVPQVTYSRWSEDLSGRIVMSTGVPYLANRPGEAVDPGLAPPAGTILHDIRFAPGEFDTSVLAIDGDSDEEMRTVLMAFGMTEEADAAWAIAVIGGVFDHWTLTNAQHRTLLRILGGSGGFEVAGTARDRSGRDVIAFRAVSDDGHFEQLLLVSAETGRIVGNETIRLRAIGNIPAGTVMSYVLWEVGQ